MIPDLAELQKKAKILEADLIKLRRALHSEPEIGFSEHHTSARIQNFLHQKNVPLTKKIGGTGFFTDIIPPSTKKATLTAYRADMDALPITDLKKVPYSSLINGMGHMCGHDVHSTIASGISILANQYIDELPSGLRVFWQPAEETSPSGAPVMIRAGVLENVTSVFGIHVDPTLRAGRFSAKAGADTASFDAFEVTIKAPSTTHTARPHTGRDTLWIATKLVQELFDLPGRITDVRDPAVIALGTFKGGDALNVIPDHVYFGGTIRASTDVSRLLLTTHLKSLIEHYQSLYNIGIILNMSNGAPAVVNDENLVIFARETIVSQFGSDALENRRQSMGAEDFAHYTDILPGLFLRVGTSGGPDTSHPLHSNLFDIDESIIAPTCAFLTYLLFSYLEKGDVI